MARIIEITEPNGYTEAVTFRVDDTVIFRGEKRYYGTDERRGRKANMVDVQWHVSPARITDSYLRELADFYDSLRNQQYKMAPALAIRPQILFSVRGRIEKERSLPATGEGLLAVLRAELPDGFSELVVNTPDGSFDLRKQPEYPRSIHWSPFVGAIGVTTPGNVSSLVTGLMHTTARYHAELGVLQGAVNFLYNLNRSEVPFKATRVSSS